MTPDRSLLEAVERHNWEDLAMASRLPGARLVERPGLRFVDSGTPVPFFNAAVSADLGRRADDAITEVTEILRDQRASGMWRPMPSGAPPDVGARLEAAGWTLAEAMPWMGRTMEVHLPDPPPVEGLEVRRVTTEEDQAGWVAAMSRGFEIPDHIMDALDQLGRAVGTEGPWLRFVALLDGRPVGSAGITITGDVAGLHNVSTLPQVRRTGIGTVTALAALQEARRRGAQIAVLGTTEMGRSIYERLGFRHVVDMMVYAFGAH